MEQHEPGSLGAENHTIYIQNLDDGRNPQVLRQELTEICEPFGEILEIICMKSFKRRGQAWVVFKEISAARECLLSIQGMTLFNKPIRAHYAKAKCRRGAGGTQY